MQTKQFIGKIFLWGYLFYFFALKVSMAAVMIGIVATPGSATHTIATGIEKAFLPLVVSLSWFWVAQYLILHANDLARRQPLKFILILSGTALLTVGVFVNSYRVLLILCGLIFWIAATIQSTLPYLRNAFNSFTKSYREISHSIQS